MAKFGEVPDSALDEPELERGLEIYAEAFYDLETERSYVDGFPLPIPYSKIRWYAETILELGYDEVLDFHDIIKALDNWVISEAEKKRKSQLGKSKSSKAKAGFRSSKA